MKPRTYIDSTAVVYKLYSDDKKNPIKSHIIIILHTQQVYRQVHDKFNNASRYITK